MGWERLDGAVWAKADGPVALRVSQGGETGDREVAELLARRYGGEWRRRSEWSAANGEPDVTARWLPWPTATQLDALRTEAAEAGDLAQVALCERALDGEDRALDECAGVLAERG